MPLDRPNEGENNDPGTDTKMSGRTTHVEGSIDDAHGQTNPGLEAVAEMPHFESGGFISKSGAIKPATWEMHQSPMPKEIGMMSFVSFTSREPSRTTKRSL